MMEIEIQNQKENVLLNRKEVHFVVKHAKGTTPKRDEVREKLAGLLNTNKANVVVDEMESEFGKAETVGYAKVYPSPKAAADLERHYLLKRNKFEGLPEKKKAAAPAAAAPAKPARK